MARSRVHWCFDADVGLDETPQLLTKFTSFLDQHHPGEVICDVGAIDHPSLGTMNALARMALLAKRRRAKLVLTKIGPRLWTMLRTTGMDGVLGLSP